MEEYSSKTPVKILYEARKKRQSGDVKENIKLYTGVIENTKGSGSKTKQPTAALFFIIGGQHEWSILD